MIEKVEYKKQMWGGTVLETERKQKELQGEKIQIQWKQKKFYKLRLEWSWMEIGGMKLKMRNHRVEGHMGFLGVFQKVQNFAKSGLQQKQKDLHMKWVRIYIYLFFSETISQGRTQCSGKRVRKVWNRWVFFKIHFGRLFQWNRWKGLERSCCLVWVGCCSFSKNLVFFVLGQVSHHRWDKRIQHDFYHWFLGVSYFLLFWWFLPLVCSSLKFRFFFAQLWRYAGLSLLVNQLQ